MERKRYMEGLLMGCAAFTLWGVLPLYWKWVGALTPYQVFAQRVVWSFIFVFLLMGLTGRFNQFKEILKKRENWTRISACALVISANWLLYIWAVNNGFVIEASLGYFINPLVLTLFGGIFYQEKLVGLQKTGIALAAAGVIIRTIFYGKIPVVALILALTFATYGLLKKGSKLDTLNSVGFETLIIGVPALGYLIFAEGTGIGITGNLPWYFWLMIGLSGVVTASPLILYSEATKRLPLSVVGFLQYIAPTLMLLLGVVVFKEPFDVRTLFAFALIWVGLVIFSYSQFQLLRHQETAA